MRAIAIEDTEAVNEMPMGGRAVAIDPTETDLTAGRSDQDEHYKKLWLDPKYYEEHANSRTVSEAVKMTPFGETAKKRALLQSFLSYKANRPLSSLEYEIYRDNFARGTFGKETVTDDEMFGLMGGLYQTRQRQEDGLSDLSNQTVLHELEARRKGQPSRYAPTFANWSTRQKELGLDREKEGEYLTGAFKVQRKVLSDLAPYADDAAKGYDILLRQVEGKGDETEAREYMLSLSKRPSEYQDAVLSYIYTAGLAANQDEGGWKQLLSNFTQVVTRSFAFEEKAGLLNEQRRNARELRQLESGDVVWIAKDEKNRTGPGRGLAFQSDDPEAGYEGFLRGNWRQITPEERQQMIAERQEIAPVFGLIRKMNQVRDTGLRPINNVVKNPWSLAGVGEQVLYAVGGSTGVMTATLMGAPAGFYALTSEEADAMMIENPDMDPDAALGVATVSALFQTALNMFQLKSLSGRLSAGIEALEQMPVSWKKFALASAISFGEQSVEEVAQNFVSEALPALASYARDDMKKADVESVFGDFVNQSAIGVIASLPFGVVGGGLATFRDFKDGGRFILSREGLGLAGFSEEQSQRIQSEAAKGEEAGLKAYREEYKQRSPENIKAADEKLSALVRIAQDGQNDPEAPKVKVRKTQDGMDWVVSDADGTEILTTPSMDQAIETYAEARSARENEDVAQVRAAIQFLDNDNLDRGRAEGVQTFEQVDQRRTLADETKEQSFEALQEKMRIAGIAPGTDLGTISVLGKNITSLREGVFHDVSKLFSGATALTVFHERLDGETKRAIYEKSRSLEWFINEVRQAEDAMGEAFLVADADGKFSQNTVVEAVTTLGEAFVMGHLQDARLPVGIRKFFVEMVQYFREVFSRAGRLRRAIAEGKVSPEFHDYLAESVGLPLENRMLRAQREFEAEMLAEARDAMRDSSQGSELLDAVKQAGGLPAESNRFFGPYSGELKMIREAIKAQGRGAYAENKGMIISQLFSKDAPDPDALLQSLNEQGFDFFTVDDLWNALDERLRTGKEQYGFKNDEAMGYESTFSLEPREVFPWPSSFPVIQQHTTGAALQKHPDYAAAKAGDAKAARRVVKQLAKPEKIRALATRHPAAIVVAVHAEERSGRNKLPVTLASYISHLSGLSMSVDIVQSNKVGHTGADMAARFARRATFDGQVEHGREYILVDDFVTSGGTLADLRNYIESNGGKVVEMMSLANSSSAQGGYSGNIAIKKEVSLALKAKFGEGELREFLIENGLNGGNVEALTNVEGQWLLRFRSLAAARDRILASGSEEDARGKHGGFQGGSGRVAETSDGSPDAISRSAEGDLEEAGQRSASQPEKDSRSGSRSETRPGSSPLFDTPAGKLFGEITHRPAAAWAIQALRSAFLNQSSKPRTSQENAGSNAGRMALPIYRTDFQKNRAQFEEARRIARGIYTATIDEIDWHYSDHPGTPLRMIPRTPQVRELFALPDGRNLIDDLGEIRLADGEPTFSIMTDARAYAIQGALAKMAKNPKERLAIYERARDRMARLMVENRRIIDRMKDQGEGKGEIDRARMVQMLGEYEALLSILPPEVRGKIGGFRKMAEFKTEKARHRYFLDRIDAIDKGLETALRKNYRAEIEKYLKQTRPKAGDSGVRKSTLGPEAQNVANSAYRASLLDEDATAKRLLEIEAALNADYTPELAEEWAIVNSFGDLANRNSESLSNSLKWIKNVAQHGRKQWAMMQEARLVETRKDQRAIVDAMGGTDLPASFDKAHRSRLLEMTKNYLFDHYNFEQFLRAALPKELAPMVAKLADRYRKADNGTMDAEIKATQEMMAMIRASAKSAGKSAASAVMDLKKKRENVAEVLVGRKVATERLTIEQAEKIASGAIDPGKLSKADIAELRKELAAIPADSRKEYVTIQRVIYSGDMKPISMSHDQAIQILLSWRQKDVQDKMRRGGWMDSTISSLESMVAKEVVASSVFDFLKDFYSQGASEVNPVYARMFGMNLPSVTDYAPTRFKHSGDVKDIGPDGMPISSGGAPGFAKSRVSHSAPIAEVGATEVFQQYVAEKSHWVNFAELARDYRSVFANGEVRIAIENAHGTSVLAQIDRWGKLMEQRGGDRAREAAWFNGLMGSLISGKAVASLGFNPKTILMQTDSGMRFLMATNPKEWVDALLNPAKLVADMPKVWHSNTVQRRLLAGANPETQFLLRRAAAKPGIAAKISELSTAPMQWFDVVLTTLGGAIVYRSAYKDTISSGATTAIAERVALDALDAAVYRFSQPTGTGNRSLVENSSNVLTKSLMVFMSDPRLKTALIAEAVQGIVTGKGSLGTHIKTIATIEVMALFSHYISSLYRDSFSDDDDEEIWSTGGWVRAAALAPFQGWFFIGTVADVALSQMTGEGWFAPSRDPLVEMAQRGTRAVKNFDDTFNFDDPEAMRRQWENIARTIAFNPNMAAPAAAMNLLKPIFGLKENLDSEN